MKKGFTLIELLAVIVILAIIALIATPIILGIIEDARNESKVRSAELYLTAIEQAIIRKKMNDAAFNPSNCYNEGENVVCGDTELLVDIDGEKPEYVNVNLENGKATYAEIKLESNYVIYETGELTIREETPASCFSTFIDDDVIDDDNVTITNYDVENPECGTDVIIPSIINNKLVIRIGDETFKDKGITSVVIPNSVTSIGISAFEENQLTSVVIPNRVEIIETYAFYKNQLTSVIIPNSVIDLWAYAFDGNPLTSVIIKQKQEECLLYFDEGQFGNFDIDSIKWQPVG